MTTITTNGHIRDLVAGYQLPAGVLESNFDYLGENVEGNDELYSARFFKYRDSWYDVNEFQVISTASSKLRDPLAYNAFGLRVEDDSPLRFWGASQTDSVWSAVVIRWGRDWDGQENFETVVVGSAYWG